MSEAAFDEGDDVDPRDMTDRDVRMQAVGMAHHIWGACPDLLDHANSIANFIMSGTFAPKRPSAEIISISPPPAA